MLVQCGLGSVGICPADCRQPGRFPGVVPYHLYGGEADLLVTDGRDLYLTQNKFDAQLNRIPLKREWISGYTPMGANHMMASAGFLDDTMMHRIFMVYDDA